MSSVPIDYDALLDEAIASQERGDFGRAESLYEQVLAARPRDPDALHLLGVLHHQTGRRARAIELLRQAVEGDPEAAMFRFNLGEALRTAQQAEAAAKEYVEALRLEPGLTAAHLPLAETLAASGQKEEARRYLDLAGAALSAEGCVRAARVAHLLGDPGRAQELLKRALSVEPEQADALLLLAQIQSESLEFQSAAVNFQRAMARTPTIDGFVGWASALAEQGRFEEARRVANECLRRFPVALPAHYLLGICAERLGDPREAMRHYQVIVENDAEHIPSRVNLAVLLRNAGEPERAMDHLRTAHTKAPGSHEVLMNLAISSRGMGKLDEAIAYCREAMKAKPGHVSTMDFLATSLNQAHRSDEALEVLRQCREIDPDACSPCCNMGTIYLERGELEQAKKAFQEGIDIDPTQFDIYSNVLFASTYDDTISPADMLSLHRQWGDMVLGNREPPRPMRPAHGRIRVGYVSPDFRRHVAVFFIAPLLNHANPERFETFCYSNVSVPDVITRKLQQEADHWRNIAGLPDERVKQMIEQDEIDILVDLAGHTSQNRMTLFAHRPAPIQVTMIGYPNTTGLRTVDYQISDGYLHPVGWEESGASEAVMRLPEVFASYVPPDKIPAVGPLPAERAGHVTFGSFNNLAKLRPAVFRAWAKIAAALPEAQFVIQTGALADPAAVKLVEGHCRAAGLPLDRVSLRGASQMDRFFEELNAIDIGLDSFPFNGHTTSVQLMYMGVPVIALAGRTRSGRMGVSLLSNLGLTELIGETEEGYVEAAVKLARDLPRLAKLRGELRERMKASPIMHTERWTRYVEAAFEKMYAEREGLPAPRPPAPAVVEREVYAAKSGATGFSIVMCGRNARRRREMREHLRERFAGVGFELLYVNNPQSLAEGYNAALAEVRSPRVIFMHDDIELMNADAAGRIERSLEEFDVVGVAGTDRVAGPGWILAGRPHIFGRVAHRKGKEFLVCVYGGGLAPTRGIQAVDGLLIAARTEAARKVGFDEKRFDGFHLYDVDFSYRAYRAGLRIGVIHDLDVLHASSGKFDATWERYAMKFTEKFGELAGTDVQPSYTKKPAKTRAEILALLRGTA